METGGNWLVVALNLPSVVHYSSQALLPACVRACIPARLLQLSLILCDPMDCSLPGSSVHGILQVRILEWVARPSSLSIPKPPPFSNKFVSLVLVLLCFR